MIGRTLSHFKIIAKLGEGGMGEVYRAEDSKLGREVAIKVLPETVSAEPERSARFDREARVLASLNHSSIAAIYSFEHEDSVHFLVMELVEGEDLAERMARGPVPLDEALPIALQIAEALETAHEHGIIHRDLKPANVRVTAEGQVKVLDFGLAKAFEPGDGTGADADHLSNSPTLIAQMTRVGALLGTAAYMSPEQARGQEADKRADIWSFGVVLYELLAGKRLFDGASMTDVLAAVVRDDLDFPELPEGVPPSIRGLLARCLDRDPKNRLRDIGEARVRIARALESPEKTGAYIAAPSAMVVGGRKSSRPYIWGAMLVLVAAIAVGAITWPWAGRSEPANLLSGATMTRITGFAGSETSAAISRDGKTIACLSDRGGQFDVWVIPVSTGQPYNLTKGLVGGLQSLLRSVSFSPDGSEVVLAGSQNGRLRRMPLLGGTPRNWLEPQTIMVSWSPDGSRVVYQTSDPGDPLIVADGDGSDRREILNAGSGYHQHYPTWGADGWIYLVRGLENTRQMDLWRVRPDGTGSERLVTGTREPVHPTPIDEKTVLFIGQDPDGAGPWLWAFDLERRVARRLSFGLEQYTSLAASANGRRLVASVANPRVSLWQVPISGEPATESDVGPFELPTVRALAPRFGPEDLFYLSSLGSGDGLWRFRNGTTHEIWKGTEVPLLEPVAVSADGASLALILRQNERNVLHVLSADGAELRTLSSAVDVLGSVSWSPDGAWIVAGGEDLDGLPGLFKVGVDGGRVEKIVEGQALDPVWSPTEELIVYEGPQVNAFSPVMGVRPDGASVDLPSLEILARGQRVRFLPDGRGLIHMKSSANFRQDFWLLDLSTLQDRQLTRLDDAGTINTFDITPDGKRIVFDRLSEDSDIVLIELASPK
jgi:Tol biopolymer transport system component